MRHKAPSQLLKLKPLSLLRIIKRPRRKREVQLPKSLPNRKDSKRDRQRSLRMLFT